MAEKCERISQKTSELTKMYGFGGDSRIIFSSKNPTPGPGSYQAPSAFGHYVARQTIDSSMISCGRLSVKSNGRSSMRYA